MLRRAILASVTCLLACQQASAIDKEALLSKYRNKLVVVIKEGLSTCLPTVSTGTLMAVTGMSVFVNNVGALEQKRAYYCQVEPMHFGEVLKVSQVSFVKGNLWIRLLNVSPHGVTRGIGAFAHESPEMGSVVMIIWSDNGKDLDKADALAAQWLKPFDTAADAVTFGNTSSGVFVKQVKAGMSFAEVEKALGVPETRVDLGEKILYKYKDMTVEFHDGKVTDVR
jgi:hypothetical protein